MTELRNNLRTAVVVTLACLTCVFLGFMMGLASAKLHKTISKVAQADESEQIIRPAAVVDADAFNSVAHSLMNHHEAKHRSVQGMPLKMVMMKFGSILKSGLSKHDAAQLEKKMMNVTEAVFSDFTNVPVDDVERFKIELLPLLDFLSSEGESSPGLDCVFGISEDGGESLSGIVLIMSHSNLQIVRFMGKIDLSIMELLTGNE